MKKHVSCIKIVYKWKLAKSQNESFNKWFADNQGRGRKKRKTHPKFAGHSKILVWGNGKHQLTCSF